MPDQTFAGGRQSRSGLVSDEKPDSEKLLQRSDAGADGRLSEVKPLSGGDEAAAVSDFKKRSGLINVHQFI
jgi:hypothetical protein